MIGGLVQTFPKGEAVSDISRALSLSMKTVSTYRTRALLKLHVASNRDLGAYARLHQLIE